MSEDIKKIQTILDKILLMNYSKRNAGDFNDILSFIYKNLEYSYQNGLSIIFQDDEDQIEFEFYTYYDEFEENCSNKVIISKDLSKLFIDINYGSIHFYDNFILNRNSVIRDRELVENYIDDENEKYYAI